MMRPVFSIGGYGWVERNVREKADTSELSLRHDAVAKLFAQWRGTGTIGAEHHVQHRALDGQQTFGRFVGRLNVAQLSPSTPHPPHRLPHRLPAPRIRQPPILPAPCRIEIRARRHRHAGLAQQTPGQRRAVVRPIRHIGVDVERAICWQHPRQPQSRQRIQQQLAVRHIDRLVGLQLLLRLERGQCRHLRDRRRRDVEVLRQALDRPHQRLRQHHPADPPARHREVFREAS